MSGEGAPAAEDVVHVDVRIEAEPMPAIVYRSHLTVYEEALIEGRFVGRYWNAAGFVSPWEDVRLDPASHHTPQAFWIELDGQLLHSHWQWEGAQQEQDGVGRIHVTVDLRHAVRPVRLRVHTMLDGTPFLTRWIEITNTGDRAAGLSAACPWSGVLHYSTSPDTYAAGSAGRLFSLGYMEGAQWGDEGNFAWHSLPAASYRVDGKYRRGRFRHPLVVVRNELTGEHVLAQLAWSGGYSFEFDLEVERLNQYSTPSTTRTSLFFKAGPEAPAPLRVLAPGETVCTPELHLGMVLGDLDAGVQAMHDHLRRSVFRPEVIARPAPVEGGIGPELEITEERVFEFMDRSAALGCELFFIDASWYAAPNSRWWNTVGDWQVGSRFPRGLGPFREHAHALGMKFGLWMEPERLGPESHNIAAHPTWITRRYDGRPGNGHLDLTQPEVAAWVEEQITQLLSEHQLDFFRLDYNIDSGPGFTTLRDGFVENHYWRYYDALYGIFARLRERFPEVIFENCASGGSRTDIGMVRHFDHTWVTDWQIAPRSFWIVNGLTMALPPEYVDRVCSGQNSHVRAHLDFQARLVLFGRPSVGLVDGSDLQVERLKHVIDIYKQFVRPFHRTGRIFHHTPSAMGGSQPGWGVLELAARDASRAVVGLFRLDSQGAAEYLFRPRGIDIGRRYVVSLDNAAHSAVVDGYHLQTQGIPVRLEGALTSELILLQAQ